MGGSMPIVTSHYTLDRSKLPVQADELRVRFVPQPVNGKNRLLVLYANSEPGFEPSYLRYAVGMEFRQILLGDRTVIVAHELAPIGDNGKRLVGMINDGLAGQ